MDRERCRQAGIPGEVGFTTTPALAWQMLHQAIDAGVPCTWVTGDSIYVDYRSIRLWLGTVPKGLRFAVSGKEYVNISWQQHRVGDLLSHLPTDGWHRLSAWDGAQGPRLSDWLRIALMDPPVTGWKRWLLVRRSTSDPTERTAYACFPPADMALDTFVQVAGQRWTSEACLRKPKARWGSTRMKCGVGRAGTGTSRSPASRMRFWRWCGHRHSQRNRAQKGAPETACSCARVETAGSVWTVHPAHGAGSAPRAVAASVGDGTGGRVRTRMVAVATAPPSRVQALSLPAAAQDRTTTTVVRGKDRIFLENYMTLYLSASGYGLPIQRT